MSTDTIQETNADIGDMDVQKIPMGSIRISDIKLRNVDKTNNEYIELYQSIQERVAKGQRPLIKPITVRPDTDPTTNAPVYKLITGLQRFTACTDLGLIEIHATIEHDMSNMDALIQQLNENFSVVKQKPAQAGRQFMEMMIEYDRLNSELPEDEKKPPLTPRRLAQMVSQPEEFIKTRLKLVKLNSDIQEAVDSGYPMLMATKLADFDEDTQVDLFEQSRDGKMTSADFAKLVKETKKVQNQARKEAKAQEVPSYNHEPKLRKKTEMLDVFTDESNVLAKRVVEENDAKTPLDGFVLGIAWALKSDPKTIEELQKKWDEDREAAARAKQLKDEADAAAAAESESDN